MASAVSAPLRVSTGISGLDDVLHGGLTPNRLYLVEGNPGAGKTTIALQFLMEAARAGERCLYITLSETQEELLAAAASHGWKLDGIAIVELAPDPSDLEGETLVTMYSPSEVELTETTRKIIDAVEKHAPTRVVFDSLSEMRLLAQSPLRYRRQILALKQFLLGRHCTALFLDDRVGQGEDVMLHSIAHGVISLEHAPPIYGATRRRLHIDKFRGSDYRSGYHDMSIKRGGVEVFPRLVAAEHEEDFEPDSIKSGLAPLDALLGGGPGRGTSTLLMGPAGCGKSTIAMQYAVAATRRGEHAAVFAFDESVNTLVPRMAALGIPLVQGRGKGQVSLEFIDPAELSPGEFVHLVRHSVEVDCARVVVIDSLNGYLNAMPEEQFLTAQLHELLTYLGRCGVTTFMVVAQHGIVGTGVESPVDASYLADSVVVLRFFEYGGKVRKAISVVKKRSGPHEESIRELRFDGGIQLSPPLTEFRGILSGVPVRTGDAGEDIIVAS
jgi:circadian clock protein KaiC